MKASMNSSYLEDLVDEAAAMMAVEDSDNIDVLGADADFDKLSPALLDADFFNSFDDDFDDSDIA